MPVFHIHIAMTFGKRSMELGKLQKLEAASKARRNPERWSSGSRIGRFGALEVANRDLPGPATSGFGHDAWPGDDVVGNRKDRAAGPLIVVVLLVAACESSAQPTATPVATSVGRHPDLDTYRTHRPG
jgi:hypothetical protein